MDYDMEQKFKSCLEMQNDANMLVDEDYLNSDRPWWRAAYMESVEAIDHVGWKWWKHHDENYTNNYQLNLELVDVWHFIFSDILVRFNGDIVRSSEYLNSIMDSYIGTSTNVRNPVTSLETYIRVAMFNKSLTEPQHIEHFMDITINCIGSISSMLTMYIGKNMLNTLRYNNGYKDGSYIKLWVYKGKVVEDNEVLEIIILSLAGQNPSKDDIYDRLMSVYRETVKESLQSSKPL